MHDIDHCNVLRDIRDVLTDMDLPQLERTVEYVRQIGDPYHFMCGPYRFTAVYPEDAPHMNECLRGAF